MIKKIIDDVRHIERITFMDEDSFYAVGETIPLKGEITLIAPYEEKGEMALVIWFAIYCGDNIVVRVNGAYVNTVQYKKMTNP